MSNCVTVIVEQPSATFEIRNVRADPNPVTQGDETTVYADIVNTSSVDGTATVQLKIDGKNAGNPMDYDVRAGQTKTASWIVNTSSLSVGNHNFCVVLV